MVFLRSRKVTGEDLTDLSCLAIIPEIQAHDHFRVFYNFRLLELEPFPQEDPRNWLDRFLIYVEGTTGFEGSGDTRKEACHEAILKLAAFIDGRLKINLPFVDEKALIENMQEKSVSGRYKMEKNLEEWEMQGKAIWKSDGIDLSMFADISQGVVRQVGWCDMDLDGCWYVWREPSVTLSLTS